MRIFNSLRFRSIGLFILVIIPLVFFLYYANYYSMNVVRSQVAKSSNELLSLHIAQIEQSMDHIRTGLWQMIYDDPSINSLLLSDYGTDQYKITSSEIGIKFNKNFSYYSMLDTLVLYVERDKHSIIVPKNYTEPSIYSTKVDFLEKHIQLLIDKSKTEGFGRWQLTDVEGQKFLFMMLTDKQGMYIGTLVKIEDIVNPLVQLNADTNRSDNGGIIILSESGEVALSSDRDAELVRLVQLESQKRDEGYSTVKDPVSSKKYLIILKKTENANLTFAKAIPEAHLLMALPDMQRTIVYIPYLLAIVIAAYLISLNRVLLNPMKDLIKAMRRYAQGNGDIQIKARGANEFRFLTHNFNQLMEQVKELKINVYEEKLQAQRSELKHLQSQISPHFFANSLNVINSMAFLKDYKSVQRMAQHLADYNRFITRSGRSLIPLREEIHHVSIYLEIQKYRFTDNLTYSIDISDAVGESLIPPLSIQTFVENCIIHGYNKRNEWLDIKIEGSLISDHEREWLEISVADNGTGFTEERLLALNSECFIRDYSGDHLGIWNVERRLTMQFGSDAKLEFSHNHPKGARVRVRIPMDTSAQMEAKHV